MSKVDELIREYCPNGVGYKTLEELGNLYGGLTGKSKDDFKDGNARFITYMNIFSNIAVDTSRNDFVKIKDDERQRKLEMGDVLFTGSSENPDECGMSSVVVEEPTEPLYLNSFCFILRLNDTSIFLPDFLKYLFRDTNIRKQIAKTASGVTRFNVSKKRFAKVVIPIPPPEVQKEIVNILDKFTQLEAELSSELSSELEARRNQYEYYRDELLTFDDNRKDINNLVLEDVIISLKTGLNPRKNFVLNSPGATNHYITVRELNGMGITIFNKTDKVDDEGLRLIAKRSKLAVGDVLFSGTGTIGRTALVASEPVNWNVKEGVYIIKPNTDLIHPKFLLYYLNSSRAKIDYGNKVVGSPVGSIPMSELKQVKIAIPPLNEQTKIVDTFDKLYRLANDIDAGLHNEINARRKQYEYYRTNLLTFQELPA